MPKYKKIICYNPNMDKLNTSDKIYVAESKIPNSGRGVFARLNIKRGEVIESCPTIEIPPQDTANLADSIIITYVYHLGKGKERVFLPLGFGALYNHAYTPNAVYRAKLKEGIIEFIATKDIKVNQEITVNYNSTNQKGRNPLWFE
jgi:SET domain-containing protein